MRLSRVLRIFRGKKKRFNFKMKRRSEPLRFFIRGGFIFLLCLIFSTPPLFAADVDLQKDGRGHWKLLADGREFVIRGVDYRVSKTGQSPDMGTLTDWASYDFNHNGKCDPAYDSWVDKNANNRRDADEPVVGDFELMRRMGVNTVRWYVNDFKEQIPNKKLLRDLTANYGIYVAVGDKFGAYTLGSGASWKEGTDYRDPRQRENMLSSVRRMVNEHKTEPYTLLWLLGNENNLNFTNTNAERYPEVYAKFVNDAAKMIHEMDPVHPVALVNGDTKMLFYYKKYCPDIDIFGVNCYRGPKGFATLWKEVKNALGKPVLLTEYGGAQANGYNEELQARYHEGCWRDILANVAGSGEGNALGGFAFEWNDEWWKAGDPGGQALPGTVGKQGVGKTTWAQEYCGITSQGDGKSSPFLRRLRKVYFMYQQLWNEERR